MRARLGETDRALRLLDGIDDPAHAWGEVLRSDLSETVLDGLLAAAREDLSGGQFLRLRARLAGGIDWDVASKTEAAQAVAAAEVVLAAVDPADALAVRICGDWPALATRPGMTHYGGGRWTVRGRPHFLLAMPVCCWTRLACGSFMRPRSPRSS